MQSARARVRQHSGAAAGLLRPWSRALAWLRRSAGADLPLFVAAAVAALAFAAFGLLAKEVGDGHLQQFDEQLLRALRNPQNLADPIGPRWLENAMRDLTALGSATVLVLVTLNVVVLLAARRQRHALVFVLIAVIGARLLNVALKAVFGRPRPDLSLHLAYVDSPSFPSGHAMDSAAIYLTLGALLVSLVKSRGLKLYFAGLSVLLTLLVGLSRVYLGVHYPSDVLAGWIAGLGWAALCWTVSRRLQRGGAVERARD